MVFQGAGRVLGFRVGFRASSFCLRPFEKQDSVGGLGFRVHLDPKEPTLFRDMSPKKKKKGRLFGV